jgi:transcriptional regulator with XRE-family HTH domain
VRKTEIQRQKELAMGVAERLATARQLVGMTRTELAAACGVDASTIAHVENSVRLPSIHLLMSLRHILRISPQYLMWGSLEAVDPELAVRLKQIRPELSWPSAQPTPGTSDSSAPSSGPKPRTRRLLAMNAAN